MRGWRVAPVAALILLSGCNGSNSSIVSNVKLYDVQAWPELPDIDHPRFDPVPFKWDMPRDSAGKPLADGKIFVGLDQENFERLGLNLERLRITLSGYRARVDEVNRQRAEWRQKADEARSGQVTRHDEQSREITKTPTP